MTGWEFRAYAAFGDANFHTIPVPGQTVAYVEEGALCQFLGITPRAFRRKVTAILTSNSMPM